MNIFSLIVLQILPSFLLKHYMRPVSPHLYNRCISSRNSTSARIAVSSICTTNKSACFPSSKSGWCQALFHLSVHLILPLYNSIQIFPPIVVDSYFRNKYPLWPEFSSIYFSVVEGKSAEWGVRTFSPAVDSLVLNLYY